MLHFLFLSSRRRYYGTDYQKTHQRPWKRNHTFYRNADGNIRSSPIIDKGGSWASRIYIISITVYAISLILLYAASTTYHTLTESERINTILKKDWSIWWSACWSQAAILLSACWFSRAGRELSCLALYGELQWLRCWSRHSGYSAEMGFLRTVYRDGLDLRACIHPDT